MEIVLTDHLLSRLKLRKIPKSLALKTYNQKEGLLYDTVSQHFIGLSKHKLFSKMRLMVVAFDRLENRVKLVTLYPTTEKEVKSKIKSGR